MKKVLLTGISGEIGQKIYDRLKDEYIVYGAYNSKKIESENMFCVDFSNDESLDKFLVEIENIHFDVFISCAGMSHFDLIQKMDDKKISDILNINLKAPILIAKRVAKNMISQKSGNIIFISSIWGNVGASCESIYSAAKGGINTFSKALSKEIGRSGIRVNSISPGYIETLMNSRLSEQEKKDFLDEIPLLRFGTAEDVANLVYYLLKDELSYINGENIKIDGGYL